MENRESKRNFKNDITVEVGKLSQALNYFCFHGSGADDNCVGCLFEKEKPCPLHMFYTKLMDAYQTQIINSQSNNDSEVKKLHDILDKLVNDENPGVRCAVAKQGYGLDILINDSDWCVRREVAKQGYGLDKLINDSNWYVRVAVAKQGYGLDVLINDVDPDVRNIAKFELDKKMGVK